MKKRGIAVTLILSMLLWTVPASAVYGLEASHGSKTTGAGNKEADQPEFVKGQVIVLYEEGAVNTQPPANSSQRKSAAKARKAISFGIAMKQGPEAERGAEQAENTLDQQANILSESLGRDYVIEDTVILGAEEDSRKGIENTSEETVISTVSSDKYSTEELVEILSDNKDIYAAEPNYYFHAHGIPDWNDTFVSDAWQNTEKGVNADAAWSHPDFDKAEDPVVIAVLDTGIDYEHEDLKDMMWTEPEGFKLTGNHGADYVYKDKDPMDENGHGTHCAGIIAAAANNGKGTVGVAGSSQKVQLMAVRVLDEEGSGTFEDIISAFYYIDRAKNLGVNIKAVNCSLGANVESDIFDKVINKIGKNGILTIASAGNETADNDNVPSAPANCKSEYVISVAALDDNGELSSYSNYGARNVDIAAPGSNVLSTVCYDNYMPFLYDKTTIANTTDYYGEFGGAELIEETDADGKTVQKVTPVTGTDYNGDALELENRFGESVMLSKHARSSNGQATLELTDDEGASFNIGNNKTSLRWKITGAKEGDTYVLYFPYEKLATNGNDSYMNMVFRTHTDEMGGYGELQFGDVISYTDKNGNTSYKTIMNEDVFSDGLSVSPDWNSIWQASGSMGLLYSYGEIRSLTAGASGKEDTTEESEEAATDQTAAEKQADEEVAEHANEDATEETSEGEPAGEGTVEQDNTSEEEFADEVSGETTDEELPEETASTEEYVEEAAEEVPEEITEEVVEAVPEVTADAKPAEDEPVAEDAVEESPAADTSGYGLGFVYNAMSDGDIYVDISSLAISKSDADSSDFGRYDIYSGTSMATPVATGSVALLSVMNPDLSADELRDKLFETTRGGYSGICSTGGAVDFSGYTSDPQAGKPVISGAKCDFDKKTVTVSARNFGNAPAITAKFDIADRTEEIASGDVSIRNGSIIIKDNYGLIGSEVTLTIENTANGLSGSRTMYLVKGLKSYSDLFTMPVEIEEEEFLDWSVNKASADEYEMEEEARFPGGAKYIKGANKFLLYDNSNIYKLVKENGGYNVTEAGPTIDETIEQYAAKMSSKNELWAPDDAEALKEKQSEAEKTGEVYAETSYYTISTIGEPAYMRDVVYMMVDVDFVDREAIMLLGLDLNSQKWTVYYDSLSDFGSAPAGFCTQGYATYSEKILAAYDGKLYFFDDFETDDEGMPLGNTKVYSCTPSAKGCVWKESAEMCAPVWGGKAIGQGGNLYYFLGKTADYEFDYNVYKFNGKEWTLAGTLPPAVYSAGSYSDLMFFVEAEESLECAYGIDEKGIIFAGRSFDGAGDTFRFNTSSGKIEQLGYSLWGDAADRVTDGTVAGGKLLVQYKTDNNEKAVAKTMPIKTGYVTVTVRKTGKGKGTVKGTGSFPKGERSHIEITPSKGSYVYQIKTTNLSPNLNKKYGKATKASKSTLKTDFKGKANATINVHFGKISTKLIVKKVKTVKVGKRKLKAYTNGTISGVRWKSSNKKYAKVNKNGTITFKKAGIGKTVKLTAISKENSKLKKTIKVKIKRNSKKKSKKKK